MLLPSESPLRVLLFTPSSGSFPSTGVLTRSLSSSSSSLDSRHAPGARPRPLPRQRLPARQRRERAPLSHRSALSPGLRLPPDAAAGLCACPVVRLYRSYGIKMGSCKLSNDVTLFLLLLPGIESCAPAARSSVCGGPVVRLGERVLVVGQRMGVIKFCGKTSFAPGQFEVLFSFPLSLFKHGHSIMLCFVLLFLASTWLTPALTSIFLCTCVVKHVACIAHCNKAIQSALLKTIKTGRRKEKCKYNEIKTLVQIH